MLIYINATGEVVALVFNGNPRPETKVVDVELTGPDPLAGKFRPAGETTEPRRTEDPGQRADADEPEQEYEDDEIDALAAKVTFGRTGSLRGAADAGLTDEEIEQEDIGLWDDELVIGLDYLLPANDPLRTVIWPEDEEDP